MAPSIRAQTASAAAPAAQQAAAPDAGYVGSETCAACHEDSYDGFAKTPHWKTPNDTRGGPSKQGCEGCHGPGAAHVAGGGDETKIFIFKKHSAKEINDRCLTCHAGGTQHMKPSIPCTPKTMSVASPAIRRTMRRRSGIPAGEGSA